MNRLIRGNALDRGILDKESVDLIVTSPPYNLGKFYDGNKEGDDMGVCDWFNFTKHWLNNCYYWCRETGRICVNVAIDSGRLGRKLPVSFYVVDAALSVGWKYRTVIVWDRIVINSKTAWGSWKSASAPNVIAPCEVILVFYKGDWKRERQGESDISGEEFMEFTEGLWRFPGETMKEHEAPFPLKLPERCIKLFSFVGDIVLDPFAGSGTTMVEAVRNRRVGLGIEKEERYCHLAIRRVKELGGVNLRYMRRGRYVEWEGGGL